MRPMLFAAALFGAVWLASASAAPLFDPATGNDYNCEAKLGASNCTFMRPMTAASDISKPVPKTNVWGAIAYAPSTTDWAFTSQKKSKAEAEAEVLANCKSVHGAACQVAMDIPGYCGALAIDNKTRKWGVSSLVGALDIAQADARFACGGGGCTVALSICADNVAHYYNAPQTGSAAAKLK